MTTLWSMSRLPRFGNTDGTVTVLHIEDLQHPVGLVDVDSQWTQPFLRLPKTDSNLIKIWLAWHFGGLAGRILNLMIWILDSSCDYPQTSGH
jgi:hypothetical protein